METLAGFERYLREEEKSPLTVQKYLRDVGVFLRWLEDREICKGEVMGYKAWLEGQYATVSVNSMLSSVNTYLDFLDHGDCRVKLLKTQRQVYASGEKELSRGEFRRLLVAARKNEQLWLLLQTLCATGIRVSEHRFITVEALRQGRATVRSKGKTRTVFLPKKLCLRLLKYAGKRKISRGPVFLSANGKPLDRSRVWALMKGLCAQAGVSKKKVFPHNLRHLFARIFYSMERDIVRLADILGHSSINTTRIYTLESGEVHRQQIEKIAALLIT